MKPVLQALLVADRVYTDKDSGKKIVSGVFHNLWFKKREVFEQEVKDSGGKVPLMMSGYRAGSPFAYVSLTEVNGELPLSLRYVDLETSNVLFGVDVKVNCSDPLRTIDFVVPLPPLPTEKKGTYALNLLWNEEWLGSYRILVNEIPANTPPPDGTEPTTNGDPS